ncbi:MAG: NAD(P)H-binding protein [Solirubrobacteraceae bacterium]|nr:NAD(P)H-binding protein [Solirubrobacteraceae bacterium]
MILLTGATGLVGTAVLRRLVAAGEPVRCLVRDPRGLGEQRVRVQLALGDLADPPSFRNAMRGVSSVIHLAASARDQPAGSIEELNSIATWRMVRAAERANVRRFVFLSGLGASPRHRTRLLRAKALAEHVIEESSLETAILRASLIYGEHDRSLRLIGRSTLFAPVMPLIGMGHAEFQPIWADDVADCVIAALHAPEKRQRHELAGPQTLTQRELVGLQLRALGRRRRLVPVPETVVAGALLAGENLMKSKTPVSWDEAEVLTASMTTPRGTQGAEGLGVHPAAMSAVLVPSTREGVV